MNRFQELANDLISQPRVWLVTGAAGFIGSNLLENRGATNQVYNIAVHARTTLNELFQLIREKLAPIHPALNRLRPHYREFRAGDMKHSLADIPKAQELLGYAPSHDID